MSSGVVLGCLWLRRPCRNHSDDGGPPRCSDRFCVPVRPPTCRDVHRVCVAASCRRFRVAVIRGRGAIGCACRRLRARARQFAGARRRRTGRKRDYARLGSAKAARFTASRRGSRPGFASCPRFLRQRLYSTMPLVVFSCRRWQMRPGFGLHGTLRQRRSEFRGVIPVGEGTLVRVVFCTVAVRRMPSRFLFSLPCRLDFGWRHQMQAHCNIFRAVWRSCELRWFHARHAGGVVLYLWGPLALCCVSCPVDFARRFRAPVGQCPLSSRPE